MPKLEANSVNKVLNDIQKLPSKNIPPEIKTLREASYIKTPSAYPNALAQVKSKLEGMDVKLLEKKLNQLSAMDVKPSDQRFVDDLRNLIKGVLNNIKEPKPIMPNVFDYIKQIPNTITKAVPSFGFLD